MTVEEYKEMERKLKDYRKMAKDLGGKIRIKTLSIGKSIQLLNADGLNIAAYNCWTTENYNKNEKLIELKVKMHNDKDLRKGYII